MSNGGAGFEYYFEKDSNCYLQYSDSYQLSGEYQEVDKLIKHFIETHKTQCEILFEKFSNEPHEHAHFGEWKIFHISIVRFEKSPCYLCIGRGMKWTDGYYVPSVRFTLSNALYIYE
jgi:aconitase B